MRCWDEDVGIGDLLEKAGTQGKTKRELAGQVAIVTGSGRGIGRAIAQALAVAGSVVAAVARSEEQLADETVAIIEGEGGQALALVADVTDWYAPD